MEKQLPRALLEIHADIVSAQQDSNLSLEESRRIYEQRRSALFGKASDILDKHGVDTERNFLGQKVTVRQTPAVTVEIGGDRVELTIAESFTIRGISATKDRIAVSYKNSGLPSMIERQAVFSAGEGGLNPYWLGDSRGQSLTLRQMEGVNDILLFIEQSLSGSQTPAPGSHSSSISPNVAHVPWGGTIELAI